MMWVTFEGRGSGIVGRSGSGGGYDGTHLEVW